MARSKKPKKKLEVSTVDAVYAKYGITESTQIEIEDDSAIRLPSRCLALNWQWGGGIPYGSMVELSGEENSGKTLLAIDFGYVAQHLGGHVVIVDAEKSITIPWLKKNGLNPEGVTIYKEESIEKISDFIMDIIPVIRHRIGPYKPLVLIVDSLAAMDSLANFTESQEDSKAEMGNRAKAIYKMVRLRNKVLKDNNVVSIWINQIRNKLGVFFGNNETTPGGLAMKYYAAIRVSLYSGALEKDNDEPVGKNLTIRVVKTKVCEPRITLKKVKVYFVEPYKIGFERYGGLLDILVLKGVLRKKGSVISHGGDKITSDGEPGFKKLIANDPSLRNMLLEEAEINSVSKTKQLIKLHEENSNN